MPQKSSPGPVYFLIIIFLATRCHSYADRLRSRLTVSGAMPRREVMYYIAIR